MPKVIRGMRMKTSMAKKGKLAPAMEAAMPKTKSSAKKSTKKTAKKGNPY